MANRESSEGLDLIGLLRVLKRRAAVIVITALLAVAAALGLSLAQDKQYAASVSLLLRDPGVTTSFGESVLVLTSDREREFNATVRLAMLSAVREHAAKKLGQISAGEIAGRISVGGDEKSRLLLITGTGPDPQSAADLANAYSTSFIAFRERTDRERLARAERKLERRLDVLGPGSSEAQSLKSQIRALQNLAPFQTANLEIVEKAVPPGAPSAPKIKSNALIGGFIGLLLGVGLALATDLADRRLKRSDELEEVLGMPVLGTIPESSLLALDHNALGEQGSIEAESFRMLSANLRYFNVGRDLRSILVTSVAPQDGKSVVALNLAAVVAGTGSRVLLIEADVRAPCLAGWLDLKGRDGLTSVLVGQKSLEEAVQRVPVAQRTHGTAAARELHVLPSGQVPPNPAEVIESQRMSELLREAEASYDLVIVDTPPVMVVADAIPLIAQVSGVLIVGRLGANSREAAARLREQLHRLQAPTLGVVANFVSESDFSYYAYPYGQEAKPAKSV